MLMLALMVFFIPACGDSESNEGSGSVEVVDSYLDVDEETGDYTVALIVQNNGDTTVSESSLESTAYDKDGNVIKPAEDSEGTMAFYPSFGVLQPGEKGARAKKAPGSRLMSIVTARLYGAFILRFLTGSSGKLRKYLQGQDRSLPD